MDDEPCIRIRDYDNSGDYDNDNSGIMYKGILKRIPIEKNKRLKSTITILAGWDDKETKNIVNYFINNLGTIKDQNRGTTFLFRLDNDIPLPK